jgi:hypothetical protein
MPELNINVAGSKYDTQNAVGRQLQLMMQQLLMLDDCHMACRGAKVGAAEG